MPANNVSRTYRTIGFLIRRVVLAFTKPVWTGVENLPKEGGFIVASNHVTEADALTLSHFLYDNGFPPRIMAKAALFRTPVVKHIMKATHMIPVERESARAADSLGVAARELAAGACVAIYPEGTLTRDPDMWPMTARTGVARLALRTEAPVLPLAQWGMTALWGRYSRVPHILGRRKIVYVQCGPAVDLSDLYGRADDKDALLEATDRIMDAITKEVEALRGEKAPAKRFDLREHPESVVKKSKYPTPAKNKEPEA